MGWLRRFLRRFHRKPSVKKHAIFIRQLTYGWSGDARLFRLDPPLAEHRFDSAVVFYQYVIVSGVNVMFSGNETFIFPAFENGEPVSFDELEGSFKGDIDHALALRGAGYEVVYESAHLGDAQTGASGHFLELCNEQATDLPKPSIGQGD